MKGFFRSPFSYFIPHPFFLIDKLAVDPDALKQPHASHGYEQKRASVADHWERESCDRGDCHSHSDVHENVGKEKHHDPDREQATQ